MLGILTDAGVVEPKVWCGEAKEMERFFAETTGQKLEVLSCLVAMAPFGQLQKHVPKRDPILFRFPGGR